MPQMRQCRDKEMAGNAASWGRGLAQLTILDAMPILRSVIATEGSPCCFDECFDKSRMADGEVEGYTQLARELGHTTCEALGLAMQALTTGQRMKLSMAVEV